MDDVLNFFTKLFDTSDWPPRWHCGLWSGFHGWLYIISDLLIWAAYFAIPIVIIRYITYKKHQQFIRLYFLFAAFILACGATHLLDAVTFWMPLYRLSALMRAITAVVSWLTVFYLIKLLPYAFSLKDPRLLEAEIDMRKKAEAELQIKNHQLEESRLIFKNAFEYSPTGKALANPDGRWLDVNQAICNIVGYSKEELMTLTFRDITHPDDLAQDLAYVKQLRNKERDAYQMEKRYITKSGETVWVLLSMSLVWQGDSPAFFISQIVDINAKKLLRIELEKKNVQLELANKELQSHITNINEFNRIIAHNLRGPAISLISMADYVEQNENEDDRNFLLSKTKNTASLVLRSLNDLKEFLEIQLNQEVQLTPVCFGEACKNSLSLLEEQIVQSGATIRTSFTVEKVVFPKVYLESTFYNLISNAIKYRNVSKPAVIEIETKHSGECIVLTVKDNGIGIDMHKYGDELFKYKKIFHKGYDSNGVGLFLTKTQVEAYRGSIEAESQIGEGTVFSIFFQKK